MSLFYCLFTELMQYDFDYDQTTDGRYDRRPYGNYLPRKQYRVSRAGRPAAVQAFAAVFIVHWLLFNIIRYNISFSWILK